MVVLHDWRTGGLMEMVAGRHGHEPREQSLLRNYGIGAQILADLGVHDMVLLSNTERTIVGLEGYGIHVSGRRPIELSA